MKRIFRLISLVFMVLTIMFTHSMGINMDQEQVHASIKPQKKLVSSNENEMHFQTTETTYGFYENSEGEVITLPISEYSTNSEELEPAAIVPVCEGITISVTGLNSEGYTEQGVTVTYIGLYRSATYSIDNSTAQSFNSGTVFYGMGSYTIRVTCICGEIKTRYFTINGSCVVADSDDYNIKMVNEPDGEGDVLPSAYKVTTTFSYGDDLYGHYRTKLDFTSPAIADIYDIVIYVQLGKQQLDISSLNNIGTLKTEYYYSIYSNGVLESRNNYDKNISEFEVNFTNYSSDTYIDFSKHLYVDTNMFYSYIDNVNNKRYIVDRAIVTLDFDVQSVDEISKSNPAYNPIYEIPSIEIQSNIYLFYKNQSESFIDRFVNQESELFSFLFSTVINFTCDVFTSFLIEASFYLIVGIINSNYQNAYNDYVLFSKIIID